MKDRMTASLSEAQPGELLEIRSILFDLLREECGRVGIRVGETVRVLARAPSHIRVALAGGNTVSLMRDRVRFIEVTRAEQA